LPEAKIETRLYSSGFVLYALRHSPVFDTGQQEYEEVWDSHDERMGEID
jgi:hypothetical protein